MPVKAIIDKILSDAEKEAEEILESYRQKASEIEAQKAQEIKKIWSDAEEKGKQQGQEAVRRLLSSTEMESRQSLLDLKQKVIDEVFHEARIRMRKFKDKDYTAFLNAVIQKVVTTGEENIIPAKSDAKIINDAFVKSVNNKLKKAGKKGKLHLIKETIDADGGFVLRQDRKEINATIPVLFKTAREELESEVASILFGEKL
jgi:V/A-type H+-transporting ATPase subunit E